MTAAPLRFPPLANWRGTRESLHLYGRFLGEVRKLLSEPHPRWWHVSLWVVPGGLGTGGLTFPDREGPPFALTLDIDHHLLRLEREGGGRPLVDLRQAPTGKALGEAALAALAEIGAPLPVERRRWEDDGEREYRPEHASAYRQALAASATVFEQFRAGLAGDRSPVQLWPHHFDLSFEWLSEKRVSFEEEGESRESRAQIGFGFSAGDEHHPEAYYYANPWPFDAAWTEAELPAGARWMTEPWQGTLLPYAEAAGGDGEVVRRLFQAVFEATAPALRR